MDIDAHTRLVVLLGHPVEHSLSPLIHNTAFRAQGLGWVYLALPVAPADVSAAVEGLKALQIVGANVTLPHKQAVLPLVDTLSSQAKAVGAVNTLVLQRHQERVTVYGDNTDVAGFLEPLHPYAERLRGASMVVLGAGGAARAVVYAMLSAYQPQHLTVVARDAAKAARLAQDFAAYDTRQALRAEAWTTARAAVRASQLVVNATPVGMHPAIDQTPWLHPDDFSEGQIVYDLVYNPESTRLLEEAARRGAMPLGGMAMLVAQAAASYIQWTNQPMPTDAVRAALQRAQSS